MKRLIPLFISVVIILPTFFMHSCANTTQAPTGGAKDTIPPVLVWVKPEQGTVNVPVTEARIIFAFDEYVTLKNPKNIFLSPPTAKAPKGKIHGKTVVVTIEDTLLPNTTYTLNLNDAVVDNNEGNPFPGFTYVFSTGATIDSMMVTGTVQDCSTLDPIKGATVLLYKDHSDSAVFKQRPYAAAKTDDWGYFSLPFISDTLYRIYAIKDANADNIYNPETETIAFIDSLIRPVMRSLDTLPELRKFDMKDTLNCLARKSEYELNLFREKPTKQFLKNHERVDERYAYVTFQAPNAWIDSLWIKGYTSNKVITQFNLQQDSLEVWLNDHRRAPDTLHVFVNYRKTDSLGLLKPSLENYKLMMPEGKTISKGSRRNLKHEDTTCVYKLTVTPETVEQDGFELVFNYPIINQAFDSVKLRIVNPRQKESFGKFTVERDSLNLRRYILRPVDKILPGHEYFMKIPYRGFRDINGFYCDSTEVKVSLPTDEELSTLNLAVSGVSQKYIIDLQNEQRNKVIRSYIIDSDTTLQFPYLKEGKYCIRITADGNRNSFVDTGSVLEHRQPEKVKYFNINNKKFLDIPKGAELTQTVDLQEMFKD